MARALVTNNGTSQLASGITNVAVSLQVTATEGALFPNPSGGDYFYVTLVDSSNNREIVKCTARSTDTFTIVRGIDGTTQRAFSTGDRVELRPTMSYLEEKVSNGGTALTSGRVPFATGSGALTDSAALTYAANALSLSASSAGASVTRTLANTENANAASHATDTISSGGGSGGDPGTVWTVTGVTSFKAGIDNSDSDKWKLSVGTALGTNDAIVVTTAGEITMPLQPAFLAVPTGTQTDKTGDGTVYTVICDNEIFDQNADYNNSTGVFTAPVTGRYSLSAGAWLRQITASHTLGQVAIPTSNRTYSLWDGNLAAIRDSSNEVTISSTQFCDMDAGDTATFSVQGSGGTKVIDIDASGALTNFGGFLAC